MSANNFVERFCHKYFQKNPKKSKEDVLNQLTHLYLNGRKIEEIGEVTCEQLRVLYLHNNSINKIINLDHLIHLTHLYLQWNRIERIENLNPLKHLRKLYLGYNEIQCLEGVENLHELEELHLQYQRLQPNCEFSFNADSLIGVSTSLRALNISGLNLSDLSSLKSLPHLKEIMAADNNFCDSSYIASSICDLPYLRAATFFNCPAHKTDIYYRNKIILESKSLELLDNKAIEDVTRLFLKKFDKVKSEQKQKIANTQNACDANNTVDIDLSPVRSDGLVFDVTSIISQAIVENVQCKPWITFHE